MIEPGAKNCFIRILWLVILFGTLTVMFRAWDLPLRDLSQSEGLYAAVASEISPHKPLSIAHGVAIKNRFFLYPLTAALLDANLPLNLSDILRYLNFAFLAVTAVLLGAVAGTTRDYKAGLVAAAMFCANGFVFKNSMTASPLMMGVFFLFAAQSAWIYFGFTRGQWSWAWVISLFLLSFGFLTCGFKITVYFFLPMFFLHRPIKMVSKINKKGFVLGMMFLGDRKSVV